MIPVVIFISFSEEEALKSWRPILWIFTRK